MYKTIAIVCSIDRMQAGQRKQVGHTNRRQLTSLLDCDLLGQAQVERAMRADIRTSRKTTKKGLENNLNLTLCYASVTMPPMESPLCHGSLNYHNPVCPIAPDTDVILECLGSIWELHYPYLTKAVTLAELCEGSQKQGTTQLQDTADTKRLRRTRRTVTSPTILQLSVKEPSVTKETLSFALRTLYSPSQCPEHWEEGILSTATILGLPHLFQRCLNEMVQKISSVTVCDFHHVSYKYKDTILQRACERWLELHLVTHLSCHINLRDLPFDLLLKTLRCPRLFVSSEYELLKTVLLWVYLQINPNDQILPSHSAVITFFSNCSLKAGIFLEQPIGQKYTVLFQALHLHGITEWHHLEEIQQINLFPQSWLLLIFSRHYYTLQRGGDMSLTDFSTDAIRFGMIIKNESQSCIQTIGLYGFYFILKSTGLDTSDTYGFSLERLRHWDPELSSDSFMTCPFSMVAERHMRYQITVQSCINQEWQVFSSGPINQKFTLRKRFCKSQMYKLKGLCVPILVTFALAFPSS
ncbi:BTB/POZ domain-containing protein 16 [Chanos chanos]|uniref:BTB/POZ domain-containing protein 16 n=1 Tax=Chanos chanos TaxID=29144 RepID=A0A6J2VG54_CHACN|nr:BTB/POZ domain-containing protein 16 [Chanos chanos]